MTTKSEKAAPKPYKGHKPNSRKGEVHKEFDRKGHEAATALALSLGLKPATAKTWLSTWAKAKEAAKAPKEGKSRRPLVTKAKAAANDVRAAA